MSDVQLPKLDLHGDPNAGVQCTGCGKPWIEEFQDDDGTTVYTCQYCEAYWDEYGNFCWAYQSTWQPQCKGQTTIDDHLGEQNGDV